MDTSMITTTANRNLVTRSVANGKLFNHCRRGWNWRFIWHAREAGVEVKSVADRWFDKLVISASPDSKLVRNVADMLARLNRVVVDIRN